MILIKVARLYDWAPLSKTVKLDKLIESISEEELSSLEREFSIYLLLFFKSMVKHIIKNQKFRKKFQPLSSKYVEYKKRNKLNPGFWIATGQLVDSLTYWKTNQGYYVIGWPPRVRHKKNLYEIYKIAMVLELGSKKRNIPARPIFKPLASAISSHIVDVHFKRFIKDRHKELIKYL